MSLIAIVEQMYDALPKLDWETYESHTHPDFSIVEADSLPYAGTVHGVEGMKELVGRVFELFSVFEATPATMTEGDGHVMVWVEMKMTGRESGKTINTQMIEVFKFEGDKLKQIVPFYFDTDLINSIV